MESQENEKSPDVKSPMTAAREPDAEDVSEPVLPDGVGLSLEEVRKLVIEKHDTRMPMDDPQLMMATIFNAYLGEIQKLQERHEKGLGRLMAEKTDKYVAGMQASVEKLTESLSSASVDGIRKVFDEQAAKLALFKSNLSTLAVIVSLSALANLVFLVIRGMRP